MKTNTAFDIIQRTLENPVSTWLDYTPQNTPIVIYDDDEFIFVNHPNPSSERPSQLTAATAIEINGILTATIPLSICNDEQSLVPLVYHECFHVYQGKKFQFGGEYNFFEILAFYPELNPEYRAVCSAETNILNNNSFSLLEKAKLLSGSIRKRHKILSQYQGLLDFEKNLERNEGTASFVEQKARAKLFSIPPDNSVCHYGYSRQYFIGAAICWLFEQIYSAGEWQNFVEKGKSLSELLLQVSPQEQTDSRMLDIEDREKQEQGKVEQILAEANQKIEGLLNNGAITIKLPDKTQIFRSFSPRSIISLGDGRLIHPEFVVIQTPNGQISIQGQMTLENYKDGTVIFPATPVKIANNKLDIHTESVHVSLENVRKLPNGIIEVL